MAAARALQAGAPPLPPVHRRRASADMPAAWAPQPSGRTAHLATNRVTNQGAQRKAWWALQPKAAADALSAVVRLLSLTGG